MSNHGPTYGLSRELEMKNRSRFILSEAQQVLEWMQLCTGCAFTLHPYQMETEDEIADALQDGVQLCRLIEKIAGVGYIDYRKNAKMPFHKMENISNFLTAVKRYGVPEITCFQTVDLYERKQLYKVFECVRMLAGLAQKHAAPVPIPEWVVKVNDRNERRFNSATINSGQTLISLQYGTNKGASQKGMTPYGLARQIMPDSST